MTLTNVERAEIARAIAHVEQSTSGEIVCVLTEEENFYPEVALAWAAATALLVPYLLWLADVNLGMAMDHDWRAGHMVDAPTIAFHRFGAAYAIFPIMLFVLTYMLALVPPVSRLLTPRRLRRREVHRAALEQFRARGLHQTADRTGVLIFASLADRHAEIVADEGIYTKVPPEIWGDAAAALITGIKQDRISGGLIEAVGLAGGVLAKHFPPGADNPNELPNKVIEI